MVKVDPVTAIESGSSQSALSASCQRCGGSVNGRRRNGFCSDACRMADRREREAARRAELLADLKTAIDAVRRELLGESDNSGDLSNGDR